MIDHSAITSRHSKRAFLNTPVSRQILETILTNAGQAGSTKNTQPWEVAILTGNTLSTLIETMCQKFDANEFDSPDYQYSPNPFPDTFKTRARDCGYALFDLKGIKRDDHDKRKAHSRENFECFGAPCLMIFHLPMASEKGTFLDMGLFLQNVMLGLTIEGLGSCPQASLLAFSQTIRDHINLAPDRLIVCGLSLGAPDPNALVNTFVPTRLPLSDYTQWLD
ncbi:nitroreductase [bacterium]|jgi:nitroreductase|nr:nitroreductase [bacterium]